MTTNYNVTFYSFYQYFFESLKDLGVLEKLTHVEIKDLLCELKNLFSFVKKDLFAELFTISRSDFYSTLTGYKFNLCDFSINLEYLVSETKGREVYKISTKLIEARGGKPTTDAPRVTRSKIILTSEVNHKKTKLALDPNLIQALDAHFCHFNIEYCDVDFAIHDCFSFSITSLGSVIDKQNAYFFYKSEDVNAKFSEISSSDPKKLSRYSIFITL
jgi:hypothetical protein